MQVELNTTADSSYSLFFLDHSRASEILDSITDICLNVVHNFSQQYQVLGVVTNEDNGKAELMHRLDIAKVMKEFLDLGKTKNEKNYILYVAFSAIDRISKYVYNKT